MALGDDDLADVRPGLLAESEPEDLEAAHPLCVHLVVPLREHDPYLLATTVPTPVPPPPVDEVALAVKGSGQVPGLPRRVLGPQPDRLHDCPSPALPRDESVGPAPAGRGITAT